MVLSTRSTRYDKLAVRYEATVQIAAMTMSPIVGELVTAEGGLDRAQVLWWALAIGADLGGNATAVGASANVVMLGIADRAGHRITFWGFTKYGLIVTVISVAMAVPYLWLRFFAF